MQNNAKSGVGDLKAGLCDGNPPTNAPPSTKSELGVLATNIDFLLRNSRGALISLNPAGRNFSAFAGFEIGARVPAARADREFCFVKYKKRI